MAHAYRERVAALIRGLDRATEMDAAKEAFAAFEGRPEHHRVGTAADIPTAVADLVTMTGNVAQVFLSLDDLRAVARA